MGLSDQIIVRTLNELATRDRRIAQALARSGYPPARCREPTLSTLLRIVIGQQLSVRASAAIYARLEETVNGKITSDRLLELGDSMLRAVGLSARKIEYVRALARATHSGRLDLNVLSTMSDEEAITTLTGIRGLGVWSAQMYLIGALGRIDVWPGSDLGVRTGVQRILQLADRPTSREMDALGETWRPYRSVVALLAWHLVKNTPQ